MLAAIASVAITLIVFGFMLSDAVRSYRHAADYLNAKSGE